MPKTIFTIGKKETRVEAEGFTGGACEAAINQMMSHMDDAHVADTSYAPEFFDSDLETEKEL